MLRFALFLLPLGLDTLAVSLGLGIRSRGDEAGDGRGRRIFFPVWLRTAILFALAEAIMPLIGLAIGYTTSLLISGIMNIIGALLLIAVGAWELLKELFERFRTSRKTYPARLAKEQQRPVGVDTSWQQQLLLALSVSLDELAVGFSFGTFTTRLAQGVSPLILCVYIGAQGLLMAAIGITVGRLLRSRLHPVKEWSELLSCLLLIGLGIWLLVT